ncbi:MAG: DEAD/DEAH box helicase [Nanoarchaeota archaeon]|nr:DEAD/DEAH box helicase [Nanoarchaeota archaeon]
MPEKFLQNIIPREYQNKIFKTCSEKNCLVVLPTGLGKTLIALMLTIRRMREFPGEKILFLAPTKPLIQQHLISFKKYLPELFGDMQLFTGMVKAEQRKKIWQTADIIFSTPQCVDGSSIIFTKDGPIKIKEFLNKFKFKKQIYGKKKAFVADIKEKVLGFDGEKIRFVHAKKAWKLPAEKLISFKTELGNHLTCTPEHPLLTINGNGDLNWINAEDLKQGDYIASINKISINKNENHLYLLLKNSKLKIADKNLTLQLLKKIKQNKKFYKNIRKFSKFRYNFMPLKQFLNLSKKLNFELPNEITVTDWTGKSTPIKIPKFVNRKISYILGAMLGDGHLGNRKGHGGEVVFSDLGSEKRMEYFRKEISKVFGIKMKKDQRKGLISYNNALSEVLSNLGVPKGNKAKKIRIPKFIFFSSNKCITSFIKGIFDTDGSASKHSISIFSASKKFINDMKWLFLKIGIKGNIEERKNFGNIRGRKIKESVIYTFRFSGRKQIEEFLKTCDPEQSKCEKLINMLNNTKKPYTRSKKIIPVPELLKKIYKLNKNKFPYYLTSCFSVDNLKKITTLCKCEKTNKLKEILNLPIRWTKIKKIETKKEKTLTYDLTVEKEHNFITNFIISHNTIANDLRAGRYNLKDVSLLIEDEAHRCIKNYDYNYVAQQYKKQANNQRILGLTASPGNDLSKIKDICKNLSIQEVELRTRDSGDVKKYLQKLEFEKIILDFPPELEEIRHVLLKLYNQYVDELKSRRVLFKPASKINLINLQKELMASLARGNKNYNYLLGVSACAQAVKIQHALELLETQTLESFNKYLKKLFSQAAKKQSKGVVKLVARQEFNFIYMQSNELLAKNFEHPKLEKIIEIIKKEQSKNEKLRIIVFTQFRDTATIISKKLNKLKGIKAKVFIGQAKKEGIGLNQKQQKKIIQEFSDGEINILCATCIAEEGLDICETSHVIFYESIPSAIRVIQRRGRTARMNKGKLIMLITKGTRDEAFYYISKSREKKMHTSIEQINQEFKNNKIEFQKKLE